MVGRVGFFFFLLLLADFFLVFFFFLFTYFFFSCLHKARPPAPSGLFQKGESELRKEALLLLRIWEMVGGKEAKG